MESAPVAEFFRQSSPYTARLLESLPDPSRPMREIGGEMPNLVFPPTVAGSIRAARAPAKPVPGDDLGASGTRQVVRCFHPYPPRWRRHERQAPLLQVEKLRRHFPVRNVLGPRSGTIKALDDVTFAVRAGETLGIVGESGCGKTTLGKTLAGIHEPSAGRILFEGAEISNLQGAARAGVSQRLQYFYQDPGNALDPRWTIGRSLDEPLATHTSLSRPIVLRPQPGDFGRRRTAGEHLHLYPHELSGGQQRRVGLARILTLKPRLVILDEPTSGLDVSIQATVLKLLQSLQQAFDLTYLFISHDLSVVRLMCNALP